MNNTTLRHARYGLSAIATLALLAYAGSASASGIIGPSNLPFTIGDLVVSRVGTGSAALSGNGTAVFLDEYTTSGSLVATLALPTASGSANGANPYTNSGSATSEGALSLSADGKELLIAGYDAATGASSVAGSTAPREVAVVNIYGTVDDSTTTTSLAANNVRGATSSGSTTIYVSGQTGPGIVYKTMDTSGAGTSAETTSTNVQDVMEDNVAGTTSLYYSTRSGTTGIYKVITIGSAATEIAADTNPYAFYFTPDGKYLYVADTASATTGSILKYTAPTAGNLYTLDYSLASGVNGVTGLTGVTTGTGASETTTLYGVDPSTLFSVSDSGTAFGSAATLATAGTNEAFRGVEFSPAPEPSQVGMMALMGLGLGGLILRAKRKQSAA